MHVLLSELGYLRRTVDGRHDLHCLQLLCVVSRFWSAPDYRPVQPIRPAAVFGSAFGCGNDTSMVVNFMLTSPGAESDKLRRYHDAVANENGVGQHDLACAYRGWGYSTPKADV